MKSTIKEIIILILSLAGLVSIILSGFNLVPEELRIPILALAILCFVAVILINKMK